MNSSQTADNKGRIVAAALFAIAAGMALWVGSKALYEHDLVNWSAMSAVAHAYDVFHKQPEANLSLIGFVEPPLPALAQLPFAAWTPGLCVSGISAAIVGAIAFGLTVVTLYGLCRWLGLRWWLTGIVCLTMLLHPLALSLAASGAPAIILIWALTGALAAFARWARGDAFRDLLAAALYLSAAMMTRYEAGFVVLAAAGFVVWRSVRRPEGSWQRAEGLAIAFLMPIVYVAGLWITANWAIMGDPWHFLRNTFTDTVGRQAAMTAETWSSVPLAVLFACYFPIFGLLYYELRSSVEEALPSRPILWAYIGLLGATFALRGVFGALPGSTYWDKLITLVAATIAAGPVLLATATAPRPDPLPCREEEQDRASALTRRPIGGVILILVISGVLAWFLRATGAGMPVSLRGLPTGDIRLADTCKGERGAARALAALGPEKRVVIAGWPGFAVSLFAGRSANVVVDNEDVGGSADDVLYKGDWLVLRNEGRKLTATGTLRDLWQSRQPHYLKLEPRYAADSWSFYEAVVVPVARPRPE